LNIYYEIDCLLVEIYKFIRFGAKRGENLRFALEA